MNTLVLSLNEYPSGTKLLIEWEDKLKVLGEIDTIFETDNGLEIDEEGYEEYLACVIKVISIIKNKANYPLEESQLMEISQDTHLGIPSKVSLENGDAIF